MKKLLSALSTLLVTTTLALVSEVEADTSVQFGMEYRSDDLQLKVGLPDCSGEFVDSHSKLKFKDIEIFQLTTRIKSTCGACLYYRLDGHYGWVLDGNLRDSRRLIGRTSAESCFTYDRDVFHNHIDDKYTAGFNLGLGYPIQQCWCQNLQIIPAIGFSYDTLRLKGEEDRHHRSESSSESDEHTSHHRLRTTYWGPWLGFDLAYHAECWNLYGEFEYHFARAKRDRGSHTDIEFFNDYHRTREAYGYNLRLGSVYYFRCNWFLDGHISYKRYTSHRHHDRLLWRSYGIGLDLGYTF